jgi:glycosyltransferase involved in cell wall biosynthesis
MVPVQDSHEPDVTIAMSVLNGGQYLVAAVRSVMAQTFTNWELLIIDDGSSDLAIDDLASWVDDRVKIVRDGLNKGLATRLNEAVAMARGRYFARMDHDDVSHPQRLERQLAVMRDHPEVDLCGTFCLTMNAHDGLTGVWPAKEFHEEICRRPWLSIPMAHPTWLGKTSWFRANPYRVPAPYCSEDQELLLRAALTSRYHNCPEFLLAYRVRHRTPFGKNWKTRWAVCRFQVGYFMRQRQYLNVALALAATLARIGKDIHAFFFAKDEGPALSGAWAPEVASAWRALLDRYRAS